MRRFSLSKAAIVGIVTLCGVLAAADDPPFSASQRSHRAYQPVRKPVVPTPKERARLGNPIDAFVIARLEERGLSLSAPADRQTLLRRVTFDLTGLPPTPEETAAFVADRSPRAFERVVDRLLASPRYGEKWARHWLDLARYADSDGFKADDTRPQIWRYRDYVIGAFNSDKPYDRFITEQIAGDELWPESPEAVVATGFNRHYPDEYNARDLMQRRQEILNDITDTVGAVFLGTTYACARCHDHKYDPVLQKDYYRLQAFFAATRAKDDYVLATAAEVADYNRRRAEWEAQTRELRAEIDKLEAPAKRDLYKDGFEKFPEEIQQAITTEPARRNTMQWLMYHKAQWQLNYGVDEDGNGIAGRLKGETKKQWQALRAELAKFDSVKPSPLPLGSGITDIGAEAPKHYLLRGGGIGNYGEEVRPGFLSIIDPIDARITGCENGRSTGRRTALARWLTDPRNPLVSRVMVNRLWHYHFGRGIVGTPSDFGTMREPETHPELLDWLAATFVEQGWSMKKMHRLMVLSRTYQQSAAMRPEAAKVDPENLLLWRFRRQRLSGEEVRDAILAVSGRLDTRMGGPGVFPEIPKEMDVRGGWKRNEAEAARNRRSIYVFVRRNSRYPMFQAFDMPDTHESCGRRGVTTTAPQALNLLNDRVVIEAAQSFAGRLLRAEATDERARIALAWRLTFARQPAPDEIESSLDFLRRQEEVIAARLAAKQAVALPEGCPPGLAPQRAAALVDFCHALFNASEFVYVH